MRVNHSEQESDRETKLSLVAQLKSRVCSRTPETKYCCDMTEEAEETEETTTISPAEQIPQNGTFLPRY